jgi:hypothetical protein
MKKYQILALSLLFLSITNAQEELNKKNAIALFNFGRSFNGTGDIWGFQYGLTYAKYFGEKKTYWSIGFEGTLHDDEQIDYFFVDDQGNNRDGKSRYVTSGLQLIGGIGYQFIKSSRHDLGLSVGSLLRYQSSSIPDVVTTLFPALTNLPSPVQIVEFREPFRTLSLGAVLKLNYYYKFENDFILGLTGGFQTDTNGDTISYISLGVGKRF